MAKLEKGTLVDEARTPSHSPIYLGEVDGRWGFDCVCRVERIWWKTEDEALNASIDHQLGDDVERVNALWSHYLGYLPPLHLRKGIVDHVHADEMDDIERKTA